MKRRNSLPCFFFFLLPAAFHFAAAAGPVSPPDPLLRVWEDPPRDVRPGTRWQIQGNALRPEDTAAYLDAIHRQGFGGVEIMSYLPIYHKGNVLWGSDEYLAMVRNIVAGCKQRGMWATLNFGPGWGLGNAWVPQYDGSKVLVFDELGEFSGGIDLALNGPKKENAPYAQRNPKKFEGLLAVKMEGGSPVPAEAIDLTAHVGGILPRWFLQPKFTLKTTLPEGRWRLVAFWTALTGQRCAAGSGSVGDSGEKTNERLVDHLDREAVSRFAEGTFEKFAPHIGEEFGKTVDCVFGDSFELAQEDFFWSDGFFDEFREIKGYDLKPLLPQVIYGGTEQAPFLRYDFGHFLHLKGMEGIIGTMADACEKRGMRMRQQPHYRFTVELMEASGRVKRAETEFNIRRFDPNIYPHKLTTSGVRFYGGDWVSCEAFTFAGQKYQITPTMVKASADGFLRDGVTQIIASAGFYQPEGYLEPFRDIMWPLVQVSPTMAWFDSFKPLNDTIARSCAVVRYSRFESDVLVYSPQASVWSERVHFPAKHVRDIPFGPLAKMLLASGYDFDTVNDDLLANRANADGGALRIGDYDYRVLILPRALYLPVGSLQKIREFVESGGTCIALDSLPLGPAGMNDLDASRKRIAALVGELFAPGGGEKRVGKGRTVFLPGCKGFDYLTAWDPGSKDHEPTVVPDGWQDFIDIMRASLVPDVEFSKPSQGLTFHRSVAGDREIFFLTNLSPNPVNEEVVLETSGLPEEWNPATGTRAPFLEYGPTADGRTRARVRLAPWHSTFLVVDRKSPPGLRVAESDFAAVRIGPDGAPVGIADKPGAHSAKLVLADGSARMVKADIPALPSMDLSAGPWDIAFTGKLGDRKSLRWDGLRSWHEVEELRHFSGAGVYRQTIALSKDIAAKAPGRRVFLDLGDVRECASVSINGKPAGDLWMAPYRIDVTGLIRPGENELEIRVVNLDWNFFEGHDEPTPIPAALREHFGEDPMPLAGGQARNMPLLKKQSDLLPSGLLGPVRLEAVEEVRMSAR
jgi:hypothetical protein